MWDLWHHGSKHATQLHDCRELTEHYQTPVSVRTAKALMNFLVVEEVIFCTLTSSFGLPCTAEYLSTDLLTTKLYRVFIWPQVWVTSPACGTFRCAAMERMVLPASSTADTNAVCMDSRWQATSDSRGRNAHRSYQWGWDVWPLFLEPRGETLTQPCTAFCWGITLLGIPTARPVSWASIASARSGDTLRQLIPFLLPGCICHTCTFSSANKSGLQSHIARLHSERHSAICDLCGKMFQVPGLWTHKHFVHALEEHECHQCQSV